MSWFWITIASVLSGTLGAMGLGGGGILLLVLVWAGWPQMTAQGINLLIILPVGLLGLYFHRKNGLTDGKAAWPLLLGGLPGVLLGVLLGTRLGENTLRACFGVLILLLAARELWLGVQAIRRDGWRFRAPEDRENPGRCARGPQAKPSSGRLLWAPPTAAMLRIARPAARPALPAMHNPPRMVNNSIDSFSRTTTL